MTPRVLVVWSLAAIAAWFLIVWAIGLAVT